MRPWIRNTAKMPVLILLLLDVAFIVEVSAQSHTNFWVKDFHVCEVNGPIKVFANIITQNGNQYLNLNMSSPVALDGSVEAATKIESIVSEKTSIPLFTIREKIFCQAANKYVGELWYDIQRAAQLPVGVCPIPPGRYHVHHMLLDFKKVTLQTFPFGTLRIIIKAIEKNSKQILLWLSLTVENVAAA